MLSQKEFVRRFHSGAWFLLTRAFSERSFLEVTTFEGSRGLLGVDSNERDASRQDYETAAFSCGAVGAGIQVDLGAWGDWRWRLLGIGMSGSFLRFGVGASRVEIGA